MILSNSIFFHQSGKILSLILSKKIALYLKMPKKTVFSTLKYSKSLFQFAQFS